MNIPRLTYDIEIKNAIPPRTGERIPGIFYCQGWEDHAHMGISVIGAIETNNEGFQAPRVFGGDFEGLDIFYRATYGKLMVSFNGIRFDDAVIMAEARKIQAQMRAEYPEKVRFEPQLLYPQEERYDLLLEIWAAAGLGPEYQKGSHDGYSLEAVCQANFGTGKSGDGAGAPVWWQQGRQMSVIDYCLRDVALTDRIFVLSQTGAVIDPKTGSELKLRRV